MNYGHGYGWPRISRKASKYGAVQRGGFDSTKEARRHKELQMMERAGLISDLQTQVKFILVPTQREPSTEVFQKGAKKGEPKPGKVIEKEASYYADFTYKDQEGNLVVEDVKGYKGGEAYKLFTLKRKLMLEKYGIRIKET